MKTETTFLYSDDGDKFRANTSDVDFLMESKNWKLAPEDFKKPIGRPPKQEKTEVIQ